MATKTFDGSAGSNWYDVQPAYDSHGNIIAYFNNWGYYGTIDPSQQYVPGAFPGSADNAVIPASFTAIGAAASINSLTVEAGAQLLGTDAGIYGFSLTIANLMNFSWHVVSGDVTVSSPGTDAITFGGGGTITFDDPYFGGAEIASTVAGISYTNDDTLEGSLHVGNAASSGTDTFINNGQMLSNLSGGGGTLEFTGDDWLIENRGTIGVSGGGSGGSNNIQFTNTATTIDNYGGVISASGTDDQIDFANTKLEGGALKSDTGAYVAFGGDDTLDGTAHALNIDATIKIAGPDVTLQGTIDFSATTVIDANSQTITVNGTGQDFVAGMVIDDAIIVGAAGVTDSASNEGLIQSKAGNGEITGLTLTNTGTIDATLGGYTPFVIGNATASSVAANATDVINDNLVEVTNNGVLDIGGPLGASSTGGDVTLDDSGGGKLSIDDGSTANLFDGATIKGGEIQTTGTGVLDVDDGLLDGTNTNGLKIDSGSQVDLVTHGGTILGEIVNDGVIADNSTLYVATGTSATLDGSGTVTLAGTYIEGGGSLTIGAHQTVSGTGWLQDDALTNNGALVASGGALVVDDSVTGSGSAEIDDASTLKFTKAFDENVTFATGNDGALQLAQTYGGTISGFSGSDVIYVAPFSPSDDTLSHDSSAHTVTISSADGTQHETLHFSVDTNVAAISLTPRPDIGADQLTICFLAGTAIRTPEGEAPVETLKRGDLVLTTDGRAMPIRWLGRQTVSARFADPIRSWPIRVRRDALGDNVPSRDLLLSPDHALLIDGVLIHAGALVNGTSIVRERSVPETFVYYHVELDDHSLILAENTPAETFVDNVDRMHFDNWDEHEALYPNGKVIDEMDFPRAKGRRQTPPSIRARLDGRAQEFGLAPIGAVA